MKPINLFSITLVLLFIGCQEQPSEKEVGSNSKIENGTKAVYPALKEWVDVINNKNSKDIKDRYTTNAIKIISADSILNNASGIANYYKNSGERITTIESLFQVEANEKRGIHYEIVKLSTENLKEYIQLVIWKFNDKKKVREFEFTMKSDLKSKEIDKKIISERRDLWIKLCNEHNAKNLVNELYTSNTLYFNHKPLIIGTENLIKQYSYMNKEKYNLILQPLKLEPVSENLAIEIGQCQGSYGGKYILVWKKEPGGKWKIYVDSNI